MNQDDFQDIDEMKLEDIAEHTEKKQEKPSEGGTPGKDTHPEDKGRHQDICYFCSRPDSVTGGMFHLPGGVHICNDCMHRLMDEVVGQTEAITRAKNAQNTEEGREEGGEEGKKDKAPGSGSPKVSFINLSDMMNGFGFENLFPGKRQVKPKKQEKRPDPVFSIDNIPAPHKIKEKLDEYVVGQEKAKKIMAVAVYNHYKRIAHDAVDSIEIEKSNILMVGPTGSGKTYLVRTMARLLDVPLAIADATSLTEAGYIGDDVESVISKLLLAADNDVERAEKGIVFIDEIDKVARKRDSTARDVNGESVQQGMLKLLEGSEVEVPVGGGSRNMMVPVVTVNTRNILFICGGAFPELPEVIKKRLNKQTSIGFGADLKDRFDKDRNLLLQTTVEDLRKFGMIPEFLGRLPILCCLEALTEEMLVKILKEPKNAIIKQYQKLLELDEVDLRFDEGALSAIAKKAMEKETGARALRAIIEEFMLDIMYEIPKDDNIGSVTITEDYVEGRGNPIIGMRGGVAGMLPEPAESPEPEPPAG